ncbi:hypothetical protein HD806DRAFT_249759 [Xylariaceae sp. AK1471]|nr:hypothetical protein HD806DRAFT_249759 [Xylariaceae sp. AK1471]
MIMSRLLSYLPFYQAPRPLPPVVPTDEVVPVHLFDDTSTLRGIIMVWTFRFNEVLDPEKLGGALSRLFRMEGWRKLGGRYRRRPDNKLEIHIPRPFTDERPPLHFTKEHLDVRMNEHPLASQLPQATGEIATFPGPRAFNPLALGPGSPRKFEDYIYSDLPQFSLHVKTFTDGTLLSVSHSHMTADLIGFAAVVNAWSLILAGKPEMVPQFVGLHEDGMKGLREPPVKEEHVLSGQELTGWRLAYWGIWTLLDSRRLNLESRLVCIPKSKMERIMVQCRSQIASNRDTRSTGLKPFISEGDVLTAIACRMTAQSQGPWSTRNVMTMIALDPRTRAKSAFQQDAACVQNSPTAVFFNCPSNKALELSVGELALLSREAIVTQATEEQMKAYSAMSAESVRGSNMNVLFGDKDMSFQLISNWLKAKLLEKMDFGPAIVKEAPESELRSQRGHPTYFHGTDPERIDASLLIPLYVVMGTDYDGNKWLSCVLPNKIWPKLLDYLDSLAQGHTQ